MRTEVDWMVVPIISIRHLTEEEAKRKHTECWPSYTLSGEYGFVVYLGDMAEDSIEEPEEWPGLLAVAEWIKKSTFEWVRFDETGEVVPELPTYKHEQ